MDNEILKLKIKSLISLRTNLINVLIVLVGGVLSLSFFQTSILKGFVICIGVFYILVFLSNLVDTNKQIDKLLDE